MGKSIDPVLKNSHVDISPTVETFEIAAANAIAAIIAAALRERGGCLIALSGGNTPRGVYRRLGSMLASQSMDVSRLHLIFSDERMVAQDDPNSNYGMAKENLLSRISIPPSHVHRIKGEIKAEAAAREYERELQKLFLLFAGRCDLILLGVGEDGHTASLFPESSILRERDKSVRALFIPRLSSWRVTLTLPFINQARAVVFLASGRAKATMVAKILATSESREDIPATLVRPHPGTVAWMLDAEAASQIPTAKTSDSSSTISERAPADSSARNTHVTQNGIRNGNDENN